MTNKQKIQWNTMIMALRLISRGYMTPEQLEKDSDEEYGLGYTEALEMAYENIQLTAEQAVHGVRVMKVDQ
jgi:hypothetical protein